MAKALRSAGVQHSLRVLRDGNEAVAYLNGEGVHADRGLHPLPAVIFLDLRLPLQSGLEVLKWIKSQSSLAQIPVIILTSSRSPEEMEAAYRLGANSYLAKPPGFREFVTMLKLTVNYWLNYNLSNFDGRDRRKPAD